MYCFVKEDLEMLNFGDPLLLQAEYAKYTEQFMCCSILEQKVHHFNLLKNNDETVILRSTCDSLEDAIRLLDRENIKLLEKYTDLLTIENWDKQNLSIRKIFSVSYKDIMKSHFHEEFKEFLYGTSCLFIKTRKKGFTIKIATKRFLDRDFEFLKFLSLNLLENDELMISECFDVILDSLGRKESRHFVMNGKIMNSSRPIHTIKHNVPKSQIDYANLMVKKISCCLDFPNNYVLDIGEFRKNNIRFIDIVEINPITCSQCYVNNSIFNDMCKDIISLYNKTFMGFEYCLDALKYPENYSLERLSAVNYEYINTEQYEFL